MAIKNVLFDYGNVIAPVFDWPDAILAKRFGLNLEAFSKVTKPLANDLGLGKIDEEEYWTRVFNEFEMPLPEDFKTFWTLTWPPFEMFPGTEEFLKALGEKGINRIALSNTITSHADFIRKAGGYDLFDHVYLSQEIGLRKPEREIFEYVIKDLGIKPEESVFLDDVEDNLSEPKALDMEVIHVDTPGNYQDELRDLLGI